ncbi:hypothetical protein JOC75_004269 [Metabacillus crassostreae]|uniref:hypothetical protein n=1 Tax=Metabacillus crassostreae TaxID=929098 RepID=UPI001957B209|nr:hypothetical protein [Metabacillus crassostreae]MBM7606221.1 hypothetical protein [Metabacillus crassostreae]
MEWIVNFWLDGQWYEKVYIISFVVCVASGLIFLCFLSPYLDITDKIEAEFKALASRHLFISFRKRKQNELFTKAINKVSSRNKHYGLYQFGSIALFFLQFGFGIAILFLMGSTVYEKFILPSGEQQENYSEEYYDSIEDYEDYEVYDDTYTDESNIHHVDPHWVNGYTRDDGTEVEGYWRGGEDGYDRSNPDGDSSNNLDSFDSAPSYDSGADDGYDGIGGEIGEFIFGE